MELTNTFRVDVTPDEAWRVLTDVERIAPCMPGAQLQEVQGNEYRGVVKVKVGPIAAQYTGSASFIDLDQAQGRAVLRAEGRDMRGQGGASATVTATLVPDGTGTQVTVLTDLAVSGKVAQFGRGVMADVSARLLEQFVTQLESTVLASAENGQRSTPMARSASAGGDAEEPRNVGDQAATTTTLSEPGVRRIDSAPVEPVDLFGAAGAPVARRAVLLLAVLLALLILRALSRRPRH